MLENMYELFTEKFRDPVKGWDRFVEFLAADNCDQVFYQLDHKFEWFFEDSKLVETVIKTYDPMLLKSDFYDHLGEMYLDKIVTKSEAKRKGLFLTPIHIADALAQMIIQKADKSLTVLDPAVGTGRLLMAAYKTVPNGLFFGVDIDLRSLRIAATNFFIHDIPGYLLHANSLLHEIDIFTDEGKYNWQYSNSWYSNIDKLKPSRGISNALSLGSDSPQQN